MNLLSNLTKQRTLSFNKNGLKLHITKTYILSAYVFFFFFLRAYSEADPLLSLLTMKVDWFFFFFFSLLSEENHHVGEFTVLRPP